MIVDNLGNVVDFVVWGYTAGEVASMNVTVGGFNINSQKIAGAWNGNPIAHNSNSNVSLQRQGSVDNNSSAGWAWATPTSQGFQNALLTTPVSGPAIPVTTGIGYNTNPSGFNVKYVKANVFVNDTFVAQQVLDTPAQQTQVINETVATVNYNSNGGSADFGGDRAFPGHAFPGQDVNDFVIEATGTIVFPNAGQWTFGVNSDDGFRLEVTNGVHSFLTEYPPPRGSADTLATFSIPDGGAYQVRLLFYERGGGACVELFAAPGAHGSFNGELRPCRRCGKRRSGNDRFCRRSTDERPGNFAERQHFALDANTVQHCKSRQLFGIDPQDEVQRRLHRLSQRY